MLISQLVEGPKGGSTRASLWDLFLDQSFWPSRVEGRGWAGPVLNWENSLKKARPNHK